MISAGLLGYGFACPDMIGGGSFASFLNIDADKFDQELIVRSTQVHTLMPMMQFSVAPWRILSAENLEIVRNMARLHVMKSPYITLCALESARTGEPIVRNLEYEFPHHGYANVKDQFMLGHQLMVAPMTTQGTSRTIILPPAGVTTKAASGVAIVSSNSKFPSPVCLISSASTDNRRSNTFTISHACLISSALANSFSSPVAPPSMRHEVTKKMAKPSHFRIEK